MKKSGIWCCLVISLLALLLFLRWNFSTTAIMITNDEKMELKIVRGLNEQIVKGWYNEVDESYHFFLPSYVQNLKYIVLGGKRQSLEDSIHFDNKCVKVHKSSQLPSVFITTTEEDNELIWADKDYKTGGYLKSINEDGVVSFSSELEYITGRGNSTWKFEKKPYTIKFKEDISLCGMKAVKKWVLLANAYEGTKVAYKMMLDLAGFIGLEYTPECQWIDLYLNEEYMGNYLLCQAVDLNSGCIDLNDGILVEKDYPKYFETEENGFISNGNLTFSIKAPSIVSEKEIQEIKEYFDRVDALIRNGDEKYKEYVDIESIVKNYLLDEISYKSDTGITSTFFYKEKSGNDLYMGPVWDYDGSFGETGGKWTNFDGSVLDIKNSYRGDTYLDWYNLLYDNDINFYNSLVDNYIKMIPYLEYLISTGIDEYASYISDSIDMDMIRWDYGKNTAGYYNRFDNNIRYLKFFFAKRVEYLCDKWGIENPIQYVVGNGQMHTVELEIDGEVFRESIVDGNFIDELPYYEGRSWTYVRDGNEWTPYIPVLEDVHLKLN